MVQLFFFLAVGEFVSTDILGRTSHTAPNSHTPLVRLPHSLPASSAAEHEKKEKTELGSDTSKQVQD